MDNNRYALFGQPVELSVSPQIHHYFANLFNQQITYNKCEVKPEQFNQAVKDFFKNGGKGLNITVPHKHAAYQISDSVSAAAKRAEAVNTLWMENGKLHGDNTDGVGFIDDCLAKGIDIHQQTILVLGAGGAVSGIVGPLLELKPNQIVVANRSFDKAQKLADNFLWMGDIRASELQNIPQIKFDLVINGLSLQTAPVLPMIALTKKASYYDLKYGKAAESGINWAVSQPFNLLSDGWGMLVRQAAQSYLIWHKQLPNVDQLIQNPASICE